MRIISGKYRGKHINPPRNINARPTTDVAKEALFNILFNLFDFESLKVLDLFSGTGSIAYEFASRGCDSVTSIELSQRNSEFIRNSAKKMNFENFNVIKYEALKYLRNVKTKYSIIFADPPYDFDNFEKIPELVFENDLLFDEGWLIVEHSDKTSFEGFPNFKEKRNYGRVNFSIFEKKMTK